ncbi:MAG: ELM1/GtrOC1 family putative glycosyltransferase [Gammaproteobacteria bacterium]|nr:ELM1/GtrOC1 family putative glycosyltransferase [Gammaproteobacteria bacterium]
MIERLRNHPGVRLHAWHRDADRANPYRAWLAEGGGFVVTADSVSMIAEAVATGRPVWIASLPGPDRPWWRTRRGWRWKPLTHELAQKLAPRRFRRDRERLLQALVESGRAARLESGAQACFTGAAPEADDAESPRGRSRAGAAQVAGRSIGGAGGGASGRVRSITSKASWRT